MNIDNMTYADLKVLSEAIIVEVSNRKRQCDEILNCGRDAVHSRKFSQKRTGKIGRPVAFGIDMFVMAADDGLTMSEAADRIGCSYQTVYLAAKRKGLKFRRASE